MLLRDASSLRLIFNSFLSDLMAFPRSMTLCVELLENVLGNAKDVHNCEDDIFLCSCFNSFDNSPFVRSRDIAFSDQGDNLFLLFGSDVTLLDRFDYFFFLHKL